MKSARHLPYACSVFLLAALLAGCGSIQAPLPPSLELPKPPADLRAVRKGDHVYLFWTAPTQTMDRQKVRRPGPTRVCRSLDAKMSTCGTPISNVDPVSATAAQKSSAPKPQAGYVDTLPPDLQQQNSNRLATYAVEALNLHARSAGLSNRASVPLAPTLPPPTTFRAEVTSDGVVLTWECVLPPPLSPNIQYVYRIYRRSSDTGGDAKLADLSCPGGRYEDHTIEWQKAYQYRITVVTSARLQGEGLPCPTTRTRQVGSGTPECGTMAAVEGDDSPPQKIFTKDVYPPGIPTGLQAVYSGAGQPPFIDLLWAPDTDADLAGYNVYRREESSQPARINPDLVKTPAFRDLTVSGGKTYWYSVTAVDERGNESAHSEDTSETVPPQP